MSHRRKKHAHVEAHPDERWLVSYADMITVLMCLFIVLYAMSTVDQKKFDELKNSLASGFGVTNSDKLDLSQGVPVPAELVEKDGPGFTAPAPIQLQKDLEKALKAAGAKGKAEVKAGSTTVTISLVGSKAYFDGNRATLRPEAIEVLKALKPVMKHHPGLITVEGHADPRGDAGEFGNDWNLAAARATSVLTWMVDHHAVDPVHVSSISYGSQSPSLKKKDMAAGRNRRVDIVLHTVQVMPAIPAESEEEPESASSGHGEAAEEPASSGHGEAAEEPASSGHGEAAEEPASSGHGEAAEEPASSGHGESAPAPASH